MRTTGSGAGPKRAVARLDYWAQSWNSKDVSLAHDFDSSPSDGSSSSALGPWRGCEPTAPDDIDRTVGSVGDPQGSKARGRESTLARGQCYGRYMLLEELGAGAMGIVWLAYDPDLGRKVAMKFLRPMGAGPVGLVSEPGTLKQLERMRSRLLEEAKSMGRIVDPHVVAVYDAGIAHDLVFLAMEYVEGRDLGEWRKMLGARADWRRIAQLMLGAARGLAASHRAGFLHRDFKPANVLVGNDEQAKVADFHRHRGRAYRAENAAWRQCADQPRHHPEPIGSIRASSRTVSTRASHRSRTHGYGQSPADVAIE